MPADNGELSDAEIDELGDFLDRRIRTAVDDPSESRLGFPFFPFEGFLTGIVSGPDRIPAAEWIPLGIGYVPRDDIAAAKALPRMLDLIERWHDSIAETLSRRPLEFRPRIAAGDGSIDATKAVVWALGYLEAIRLRPFSWGPLTDGPDADLIEPIAELARLSTQLAANKGFSPTKARALAQRLPDAVTAVYAYWSRRRAAEPRRAAAPRTRKATTGKTRAVKAVKTKDVFDLRITLAGIEPPIWRLVAVPTEITLDALHLTIQGAMGWQNEHLHLFVIGGKQYEGGTGSRTPLERKVVEGDRFRYIYDFGDDWVHDVFVEKRYGVKSRRHYPKCLDGARAGPPEDCGGVPGYERLLNVIADPKAPDHEELTRWARETWHKARYASGLNPDRFNPQLATWDIQAMLLRD